MKRKKLGALARAVEIAGGQSAVGRILCVHQATVWHWLHKKRGEIPAKHVKPLVAAIKRQVTEIELRPDIYGPTS